MVERLDALVQEQDASGRAEIIEGLLSPESAPDNPKQSTLDAPILSGGGGGLRCR
jgi:hypothetical protein